MDHDSNLRRPNPAFAAPTPRVGRRPHPTADGAARWIGADVVSRIALLSDIHGNAIALTACLASIAKLDVDEVFFLGDAVGYMPDARGVLERLRQEQIPCQLGNHEAFLLEPDTTSPEREAVYRLQAASQQLTPDLRAWIAGWPRRRTLVRAGRTLLLVHGSPTDELFGYVYPDSTLTPPASPADVIVMGNTHRPFIRAEGQTLWINVGSVGLPRDHGSLSAFAVYDAVEHSCQLWRVPLDTEETLKAYGGALHESVVECLHRSTPDALGTVIE